VSVRVAQLVTELDPGGAERVVYDLATGLDRARFDPLVISLAPATGEVARWLAEARVPVASVGMTGKLDYGARRRLARILVREKVALLHAHLTHAIFLGRLAAADVRVPAVVSTVHVAERRWRPWHYLADRLTARLCDVEVCVSEAVRRHTARRARVPEGKLRVIYDGVDVARFDAAVDRRAARRSLGCGSDDKVIVSLGRLRRQKGHDLALRAMAEVARREPAARLVIVGDGPERDRLARLHARLGMGERALFAGQRDDVPAVLAAADVVVAASRYEGFGLAVAEAMAARRPVVATRVDSLPEIVAAGVSGLLVPPEDVSALSEAVLRVLADPGLARALGESGRARIAGRFTLAAMLRAHEALYDGLLRRKGAGT